MAAKKSAQNPHKWPDGTYHSIPWDQTRQSKAKVGQPPPGTYDPGLDAQQRANWRQFEDLREDVGVGRERGATDLGLATTINAEDFRLGNEAVERGSGRSLTDLLTARRRGEQDYTSSVEGLQRGFRQLGTAQEGMQRKAGVQLGGAMAQAARKRAENEAIERKPIDTAYKRFQDDSTLAESRIGEDRTTALGDILRGYERQTGQLGLTYGRGMEDLTTQERRAGTEAGAFDQDILAAKVGQFQQLTGGARLPTILPPRAASTATLPQRNAASQFAASQSASRAAQQAAIRRAKRRRL